jgi:hypothetical protein
MHLIVWSICSLKTIIPLSTLRYGTDGFTWCNLSYSGHNSVKWTFFFWDITFYVLYPAICMGLILFWSFNIRHMISNATLLRSKTVTVVLDALYIYPLTVVFCYGILTIVNFAYLCGGHPPPQLFVLGQATITIHGLVVACVFFNKSKEGRQFWIDRVYRKVLGSSPSFATSDASSVKEPSKDGSDVLRSSLVEAIHSPITEMKQFYSGNDSDERFELDFGPIVTAEQVL